MKRPSVAAAVAALVLTGVAGCSPSGGNDAPAGSTASGAAAPSGSTAPSANAAPSGNTAPSASPAAPEDPRAALRAAARKLGEQPLRFSMEMGTVMSASGLMDPQARKGDMRMEIKAGEPMKIRMITIAGDLYFRYSGKAAAAMGDTWLRVDGRKVPAGSGMDLMPEGDPAGANKLMTGLAEVRSDGPGRFAGTLDASKSATANKDALKAFGDKAKNVPFTAEVDQQGRLTRIALDMSTLSPMMPQMVTRYTDFGTPVKVTRPANAKEMPAELLSRMG